MSIILCTSSNTPSISLPPFLTLSNLFNLPPLPPPSPPLTPPTLSPPSGIPGGAFGLSSGGVSAFGLLHRTDRTSSMGSLGTPL